MNSLFCFGLGYSARLVAKQLSADGWHIAGTSTTQAGVHAITQEGYRGYLFDGTPPSVDVRSAVKEATHILLSIPPGSGGDPAFVHHGADIAASASVRWIGYFSTVGVYGDTRGGWVDEEVPAEPGSWRGQQRLSAENDWRRLGRETGKAVNVLRLPGIYGPGRSAVDDVMAGTARSIVKPGQVFNRIHVADIAAAVIAAMARADARPGLQHHGRRARPAAGCRRVCGRIARSTAAAHARFRNGQPVAHGPQLLQRVQARPECTHEGGAAASPCLSHLP